LIKLMNEDNRRVGRLSTRSLLGGSGHVPQCKRQARGLVF
jgi:hypothetical protein